MKPCPKVSSAIPRRLALAALAGLIGLLAGAATAAGPTNSVLARPAPAGATLAFTDADLADDPSLAPPAAGWRRELAGSAGGASHRTVWARMRFDRGALPPGPLAVLTTRNIDRFTVRLNGEEIFSNARTPTEAVNGLYQPVAFALPDRLVRPGINELLVRVDADTTAVAGRYEVGAAATIQAEYRYLYLWRISAAWAATVGILFITTLAGLFWLMRRREREWLFLTLYGVLCCIDNSNLLSSHYLVSPAAFAWIQNGIIYFEMAAALSYCLLFFRHPRAGRISLWLFGASVACAGLQIALASNPAAFVAINAAALALILYVCVELYRVRRASSSADAILFLAVFVVFIIGSAHDIAIDPAVHVWAGLGFYTSPYDGLLFSGVFLYTLARRASRAFDELENANQTLQERVEAARRELLASETRRRQLEVSAAVEGERERVMREIHDGIGANLVGALSVARSQPGSDLAVRTLKRALLDLKMTVDSLEPLGGDVVVLLGNFRHRIEPDLRESGVDCRWTADNRRPLAWLDAPNALHLLRIYQEAFSNILAHSGATAVAFGCIDEPRDGREGVLTFVEDNGRGFADDGAPAAGRGLGNMRSRARSIGGQFSLHSAAGAGTRIAVWLPYER